jgi:hypothetical protein
MFYSPWGPIKIRTEYAPGFLRVSAAEHEGLMLSKEFAETHLSEDALQEAERWGHFYCYDAKTTWIIPAFELPQFWQQLLTNMSAEIQANPHDYLWKALSQQHCAYLLKQGIAPEQTAFQHWKAHMEAHAPQGLQDLADFMEPAYP